MTCVKTKKLRNKPYDSNQVLMPSSMQGRRLRLLQDNTWRAEVLQHVQVYDRDVHSGKLRVIYSSYPDRKQYALPDE